MTERSVPALKTILAGHGLTILGGFEADDARAGLLVINSGGAMWAHFRSSTQFSDAEPHPMDRWTVEILETVAEQFDCDWAHPSHQPYQPFQQWALATGQANKSPMGILIHEEYGLHWAMRGALFPKLKKMIQEVKVMNQVLAPSQSPCESCVTRPCLTTCPVDALDGVALKADTCRNHLGGDENVTCNKMGCIARHACPVGQDHVYPPEQRQFHQRAFVGR